MYDTVNFLLFKPDIGNVDLLKDMPCYLDSDTLKPIGRGVTGRIGQIWVSINEDKMFVNGSSICKWFLGDNCQTMGRKDMQEAMEKLSDRLHVPMDKANVTRFDVAENFIVRHPVKVYFNHFGEWKSTSPYQEPHGLYYITGTGRLCFYDKCKEQSDRGKPISELYKNQNVLRYEQRYQKKIPKTLGVEKVMGAMLYDEDFYIKIVKRWRDTYKEIDKINDITPNFGAMKGKKELYNMATLFLANHFGGKLGMINHIKEAQSRGELTAKQAYDLRNAINQAFDTKDGVPVINDAIEELNQKVEEAARYYR